MKKPYKVMALSTLIATIVAGGIMPSYASAEEPAPIYANQDLKYPSYYLGPTGLDHAMKDTKSNMLVMDLYALTILQQADINLDGLPSVGDDLKTDIKANQNITRENARYWLNNLKSGIITTNQNIISYDTTFQNYSRYLLQYKNDPVKLTALLTKLNGEISQNKGQVTKLVDDLKSFRGKLEKDTQNLKGNAEKIVNILTGEEAGIPLFQQQIEANKALIDENNKIYIASSVATAAGAYLVLSPFAPIGAPILGGGIYGVVSSQQQIIKAQDQIIKLTQDISMAKLQSARLTIVQSDIKNLTDTIDKAIVSLENIKTTWDVMGTKYDALIDKAKKVDPEFLAMDITADLDTAKDHWEQIRKYAENIQSSEISFLKK
ncbi:HBL/NHE enterotoxin family protein [Bacillus wiedmannii]|uniref:non-hemolytic enterotoxin subunit B n=1 Tax=Bacillus wiedmannii TaxID=1890302 RepID=UPI00065B597B|nr:HBL/NHE enterotoxin family protein [Bacillus wiedmannii]KMP70357.1 enterotoxin [Bacillus cereus]MBG9856039.1 enterotoxin [Bacillus wiedmannii]MCQ6545480.1 alpha-helical pore-forming toxin family protein [Bacillus wiedmannii]MCQ6572688.1 alpha-helical pore-forming toxin family protein [Bacillus wiedmannii]MDM5265064.1 HBL/NHE enterotoxin family protein [Bacillus wiedmannii]